MRARTPRELGLLVRERRHDLRLSQDELAKRAGVSRPWLSAVETGHSRAELGKLLALFAELNLTLDLSPADSPTAHGVAASDESEVDLDALLSRQDELSKNRGVHDA
ncbi:MAG: helix-turn-helix domain-containing protein [Jatrophihabitantaceae bacterium]